MRRRYSLIAEDFGMLLSEKQSIDANFETISTNATFFE